MFHWNCGAGIGVDGETIFLETGLSMQNTVALPVMDQMRGNSFEAVEPVFLQERVQA